MQKRFCDKCKKEIGDDAYWSVTGNKHSTLIGPLLEICQNCLPEMKGVKK